MNSLDSPQTAETNATPIKPKRRLINFSLKTLLVVMTVIAVWLGFYVKSFRDRRTAVADIERLRGAMGIKYLAPEWVRNLVGDDKYFWDPAGVHFNRPLTASELELVVPHLLRFERLHDLTLPSPTVTNETLPLLLPLADKLTYLNLSGAEPADVDIVQFEQFPKLKNLWITAILPTSTEIEALQRALPNCKIELR